MCSFSGVYLVGNAVSSKSRQEFFTSASTCPTWSVWVWAPKRNKSSNPKPLNAKPPKPQTLCKSDLSFHTLQCGLVQAKWEGKNPKPQNLKAETLEVSGQEPKRMSAAKCLGVSREIPEVFQGDSTGGLTSRCSFFFWRVNLFS